jgi:uncharacterized protein YecT (DUF1311 family)
MSVVRLNVLSMTDVNAANITRSINELEEECENVDIIGNYAMSDEFVNIIKENPIDKDYRIETENLSNSSESSTNSWIQLEGKYYSIWDDELNAVYKKLLSKLNEDEQKLLIEAQKGWLQFHINDPKFVTEVFYNRESGSILGTQGYISMMSLEKRRIRERTIELMEYYYMLGNNVEFEYKNN